MLADELNIPHFTIYAARLLFATILWNSGASVEFIQKSLGMKKFKLHNIIWLAFSTT